MTKNQLKTEINDRLGQVLQHARHKSGRSISSLATAMDLTERELHAIEEKPAQIPCCKLYRVIEHYGPSVQIEIQDALCDIQFLSMGYRARRGRFEKAVERLWVGLRRHWRVILIAALIRFLCDLWRLCH
jgi:hypothetical protein